MTWLGEYPEDFATVVCMFTTHAAAGSPVAPLSAFEAADIKIYKNGSATEKTTTNGVTMTSPFDSITGLHCVTIDTSVDTGDAGFWTTGGGDVYTLVLNPDETVDSTTVLKVIGQFGINLSRALQPTTVGRKLDVSATGEAGVDWANIGSPTTVVNLSGTTIKTSTDVEADTQDIQARLPATLVSGRIDASVGAMAADTLTASALAADAVTEIQSGLATAAALTVIDDFLDTEIAAIKAKTDNLPSDPADASDVAASFAATNALINTVDDFIDTEIAAIKAKTDLIPGTMDGLTFESQQKLIAATILGKASGLATTTAVFRAADDSKARVTATVDANGNRTSVTLDAT